jgi:hypothetical protein
MGMGDWLRLVVLQQQQKKQELQDQQQRISIREMK